MGFLYTLMLVQSLCLILASRTSHVDASHSEVFDPSTSASKNIRSAEQPENDPEAYYVSPVSRSKREAKHSHPTHSKIKQNSTITHVSNTTMMDILSSFSRPSSNQSFVINKFSNMSKLESKNNHQPRASPAAERVKVVRVTRSTYDAIKPDDVSMKMGDMESLTKDEEAGDLMTAAGYKSKKYVLVKKKPKHKKIKMEVYEPKMKYKKIKMKVPVKKMKKKKVKGYLVKKEKHYH